MRAIVLRRTPYAESDLIVQFLLEDGSKVSGFAAGGRRSKKRFPHQFHPAAIYDLEWLKKEQAEDQLRRLHRCELMEFLPSLAENLDRLSRWSIILEWVSLDRGSAFELEALIQTMHAISGHEALWAYYSFFADQIRAHGLDPRWQECPVCHLDQTADSKLRFSVHEGGLVHSQCAMGIPLMGNSFKVFESLFSKMDIDPEEIFPLLQASEIQFLDECLLPYLEHQLDVRLKSRKFLEATSNKISIAI